MKSQFFFWSLLHLGSQCTLIKCILVSFFPFWLQFPYVLFMWSVEPSQDVLAVMELNSFCENESLNNRKLNYDRWNWIIRIVLNLNLTKAWSVSGLLSREILHSLLYCCCKASLIFTFPIKRRKLKESTQNINNGWLSTFLIYLLPFSQLIIVLKTGKVSQSCITLNEVRYHSASWLQVNQIPWISHF